MIPSFGNLTTEEEIQKAWADMYGVRTTTESEVTVPSKCQCGALKTYAKEPNVEYLHADYCPLHLHPDWLNKVKKEFNDKNK